MSSAFKARLAAGLAAAAVVVGASRPALAVNCKDLPAPIYGIGGSAPKPLFARLAKALTNAAPQQTLVYQAPGACLGPNAIISGTKMTGTASYWDAAGKEQSCALALVGDDPDFGAGGTFATECPGISALPAGVGDFIGPVQPYDFVVPKASSQTSISAAAAYFAYGFGASGQAQPWVDETQLITRDPSSGAALIIALAIGVPVAKLKGVDAKSNGNTVTLVATSPVPEAAIGFCSGETADANTATVSVLAYQHYNQTCGYYPSSTQSGLDKRNVRDGHYALWAPLHFFANVNAQGKPVKAAAATIIGYFDGSVATPAGVDVPKIIVASGAVPQCAMEVTRTADMGELQSYAPAAPCGCFYDAIATGATTCGACTSSAECSAGAPNCRYGYCEVN
jgi:hypothetical protein